MVIRAGDKVTKASVTNSFNETVRPPIYQEWTVNTTNLPGKLSLISYAFNNPTTTKLDTNILDSRPDVSSLLVAQMYQKFINAVAYAKTINYSEQVGQYTNGGAITYQTTATATYKGIMSDTQTKLGWTNGAPRSNVPTEGFGFSESQPPFVKFTVNVPEIFQQNNVSKGKVISVRNFYSMFDSILNVFLPLARQQSISLKYTSCHSNCHASCHNARSRR